MGTGADFDSLFRSECPRLIAIGLAMVADGEVARLVGLDAARRACAVLGNPHPGRPVGGR